ncbi:MAG TPA: TonB-dependent receptor plug domain-containing protein, partial [Guyparkeria sp.]|nr:TonB-dependent receptor plug domain-containing protein [Guyparkeria sp.]
MSFAFARMKPLARVISVPLFVAVPLTAIGAENGAMSLSTIEIVGGLPASRTFSPPESAVGTRHTVSGKGIETQGGPEALSFEKALRMVPGVDVTSIEPYGNESSMRIRGKSHSNHGRTGETIEGLPIKGIGPGLSIAFDLENAESISVIKGAVPADEGLGFGTDVGMVDLRIRRPQETFGGQLRQVLGSDALQRTFVRLDSGDLGGVARAFVSGSFTQADKWKGAGRSPDGDTNIMFGLTGNPDSAVIWELFGNHNETDKHNYRGLNYLQSQDLGRYRKLDHRLELTGDPLKDADYYDYNRQSFDSDTVFGRITVPIATGELTVKPYYSTEEGYRLFSSGNKVTRWVVDHDTYGLSLDWEQPVGAVDLKAGYWYGVHEPPGPPTAQKALYTDDLSFARWTRLEKAGDHVFHSPYVQLETMLGHTRLSAGLKFLSMQSPDLAIYDTSGLTDASYSDVFAQDPDVALYLEDQTHRLWLPNIGLSHD